eukprot:TRINITY_DN2776_c0_g1_i1.p1 TRINITY_DN2776_c0_g1~~TRINITY_DN2776_c0_g1_i1.p1  ORF type:complete len:738 (+),score=207.67 TRINITY_DN2776_c0_g1_i1:213-2216(+)
MGFPSSGIESLWRNSIGEVCNFLKKYHGDHFMIWNLSGRSYNYERFNNQILDFPFPDHHSPPLEMLFKIILSMHSYLSSNPENVAVVHCMGGKGRTGTVIAGYMLYNSTFSQTVESLSHFARKRSAISKGVIQASQIRYTKYFGEIIARRIRPDFKNTILLKRIEMNKPPTWSKKSKKPIRPIVEIYSTHHYPKRLIFTSEHSKNDMRVYQPGEGPVYWDLNCVLQSDILIAFCKHKEKKKPVKMFRLSFHCAFIGEGELVMKAEDFDMQSMKADKLFPKDFEMKLTFCDVPKKLGKMKSQFYYDPEVSNYLRQMLRDAEVAEDNIDLTAAMTQTMGLPALTKNASGDIWGQLSATTSSFLNQISKDKAALNQQIFGTNFRRSNIEPSQPRRITRGEVSIGNFRNSIEVKPNEPKDGNKDEDGRMMRRSRSANEIGLLIREREAEEQRNDPEKPQASFRGTLRVKRDGKAEQEIPINIDAETSSEAGSENYETPPREISPLSFIEKEIQDHVDAINQDLKKEEVSGPDRPEDRPETPGESKARPGPVRLSLTSSEPLSPSTPKKPSPQQITMPKTKTFNFETDSISDYLSKNARQSRTIDDSLLQAEDEEVFEDHQFMDDLIDMLEGMQSEQKAAMEKYQLHQQQQRRRSQMLSGPPKITIGKFGMM